MARDHWKLQAFTLADSLITELYSVSSSGPPEERFGIQAQARRAAVSIATNIVEGSARATTREYSRFLTIATGSARETAYLLSVAARLGFVDESAAGRLANEYEHVAAMLIKLVSGFEYSDDRKP